MWALPVLSSSTNQFSGRTGRLGNEGLATSFYNEKDEPLAPFLAKILVENKQPVPDFLEDFKPPENEPLDFDDDSGDEENVNVGTAADANGSNGDAWGSAAPQTTAPLNAGWGPASNSSQANGFGDTWGSGAGSGQAGSSGTSAW